MSLVLAVLSVLDRMQRGFDSHGKLVEFDKDLMPNSSILKDGQSVRIHLLHLPSLSIRRKGRSMAVFFGMGVAVSYSGGGGSSKAGGGVYCARGQVACGVLNISTIIGPATYQYVLHCAA